MESFGITGKLLEWLKNFLIQKRQRVVLNSIFSDWKPVLSGIPQGSILWPVLFIVFIYNPPPPPYVVKSICKVFADDTKLYRPIKSLTDLEILQIDLFSLCDWSDKWLLCFNVLKCRYIQYGNVKFRHHYQMRDAKGVVSSLIKDTKEKNQGVTFQDDLKFDNHIVECVRKANKILGLIKRSFNCMDCSMFIKLYKSLVCPHVVW